MASVTDTGSSRPRPAPPDERGQERTGEQSRGVLRGWRRDGGWAAEAGRVPPGARGGTLGLGGGLPQPGRAGVVAVSRRRWASPLLLRILAINVLALATLVAGLLYLDSYERNLRDAEVAGLRAQGELFAAAVGEGAVVSSGAIGHQIAPEVARQMLRRLTELSRVRARLFRIDGTLIADSRYLLGSSVVQVEELPPPPDYGRLQGWVNAVYDMVAGRLGPRRGLETYRERPTQVAGDYQEVDAALDGEVMGLLRNDGERGIVFSVAVPVQRYKQVLGALMLSTDGSKVDEAVREVRLGILGVFLVALAVTVLLSLYLGRAIARPIRQLAAAAERVRGGHGRQQAIPDFTRRRDEIGELSGALRDMTHALWQRMDAIERFAADVAHEIKNPLTSLRSAVETVARIEDPTQQRRLMRIILEDVQRLDRLISDISDASRLDAELSRAETGVVDLDHLVRALADVHEATRREGTVGVEVSVADAGPHRVNGIEGRLVQVLCNLLSNAASFSPPSGMIRLTLSRPDDWVQVAVEDDGPGLPADKLEAIFDRFYSERPEGEKFGTHSGLGLSISKQIVEAHGGGIVAENRVGPDGATAGARFVIRLPAR